jgi:Eco57I restriction-modification methylase
MWEWTLPAVLLLLKVEESLREKIAAAKAQWESEPRAEQLALFGSGRPIQARLGYDLSGITEAEFWSEAEGRILSTLELYAREAGDVGWRMFAEDTARGFAFIDLCRKKFDVVLMNPPFGEASKPSKSYIEKAYPRTKNDIYAAFVERGLHWLRWRGMLGAITSRTGFFLTSFQKWREDILLNEARPIVLADLGQGVLDTAMVETAAYCLETTQ